MPGEQRPGSEPLQCAFGVCPDFWLHQAPEIWFKHAMVLMLKGDRRPVAAS